MPRFVSSYDGGFCDLGMEEGEETKCAELGMKLEPASVSRFLLMEQRSATADAWARRMKRHRFHHFTHAPRSLRRPRRKRDTSIVTSYSSLLRKFN
jgi:hypothetical protein